MDRAPYTDLLVTSTGLTLLRGGPKDGLVSCRPDQHLALRDQVSSHWKATGQGSFRLEWEGLFFRVTVLEDLSGSTFFLRRMPQNVPEIESLGLPQPVTRWLVKDCRKGLVLFCGAQGSGKTTSACALVRSRLFQDGGHAVTFESPAEMPLHGAHGSGYCFQTELEDETALAQALRSAHRYASPDILFIGEIRTRHAAAQVLRAALGSDRQLVVATIHGLDLASALDRLLTFAREADGDIAARNLAQTLTAVLFQRMSMQGGKTGVDLSEFLLIPFTEGAKSIRSKLRSGSLLALGDDIREQKNRLAFRGEL